MPSNVRAITSRPQASKSSDIAREWLVKFAEVCQKDITSALAAIWVEELSGVDPERLGPACKRVMQTWTSNFLPTPGNIIAQLENADARGLTLLAEKEWQTALRIVTKYFHPQIGIYPTVPSNALSNAGWHSLRTIPGGLSYLFNCSEEALQWARRRFVDSFKTIHETGRVEHLLGEDAKKILAEISRMGTPILSSCRVPEQPESGSNPPNLESQEQLQPLLPRNPPTEAAAQTYMQRLARTEASSSGEGAV